MYKKLLSAGMFLTTFVSGILNAAPPQMPPPKILVSTVKKVTESAPKRYPGFVESIECVNVMPRITGTLLEVKFTEGSMVRKGQLLYRIEDTTYKAAVDALKAEKLALEAALKYATIEFKRNSDLLRQDAVAVSAYDKAVYEINSAKARLKGVEAQLRDAENNYSYTRIYAPITGKIGKSNFTPGNLITPSGGKMTDIEMIAPIHIRFSISEKVYREFGTEAGLKKNGIVKLILADGSVFEETARITLIDNKINSTTNTIKVWATAKNKTGKLVSGGFATVLLSERRSKPFCGIIPSALIGESGKYSVYVVNRKDNTVQRREVKPGTIHKGLQIILNGLNGDELVVIDGMHKLRPGMKIVPLTK